MKSLLYFAARYSRREELLGYRNQAVELGHCVTSRWLLGSHQIDDKGVPIGDDGTSLLQGDDDHRRHARELRNRFAREDVEDVRECDVLIAFNEKPRSVASRGGRHVEFGLAMGLGKRLWIVGPRENVFHWCYDPLAFHNWQDCLDDLANLAMPVPARPLVDSPSTYSNWKFFKSQKG